MELSLELCFLFRGQVIISLIVTIIILGSMIIGIARTFLHKRKIQCACLGTVLKLSITEATLIENVLMPVMAGTLLLKAVLSSF